MSVVARQDSEDYSDSQDIERNSTNDAPESDYDSAGSDSEHSEQDPESQETERRVDDDEDRSNPQYIPKRGTFYEHDDRTAASGEEPANTTSETSSEKKEGSPPAERRRPPRKSEVIDRWSHDKFNENEQAPKSRDELVAIYGYDIRNEDAPPHARRNRRYGRGPNKYTRTWEDEEAYRRQAAAAPRKPPNPEDFPDLDTAHKHSARRGRSARARSRSQPSSGESLTNGSALRRHGSARAQPAPARPARDKLPPIENLTITTSVLNNNNNNSQPARKVNAVAQQRPVPTDQGKKKAPPQPAAPRSPRAPPAAAPASAPAAAPAAAPAPAPASAPASAPTSAGGSKRYSSLRQRPLADAYSPQPPQGQPPPVRYHPEYAAGSAPAPLPQQLIHPVHRNAAQAQHAPAQSQQHPQQHSQQVRHVALAEPPLPLAHRGLHALPPPPHAMAGAPIQQAQGYAPPAMMPAQYMQQGNNGAVFGGAALYAAPAQAYPHQLYQHPHHNYAGGVTYYSAEQQEPPPPAPRPPRRPTAAIPIVRPDRPANSSEKDIDRIVENMFVRKPWPGAQPDTDGSEDPETRSQKPPAKESSQPSSLTSSSISTDSKDKAPEDTTEDKKPEVKETPESIDA